MSAAAKRLDGLRYHLVLGMEVNLGPGDNVLGWDPAPSKRGRSTAPPILAHVLWPNGCMIKIPLRTGVGLGPCHIVLHRDPAHPLKGVQQPPNFRSMSVVAKPLDGLRCYLVWR